MPKTRVGQRVETQSSLQRMNSEIVHGAFKFSTTLLQSTNLACSLRYVFDVVVNIFRKVPSSPIYVAARAEPCIFLLLAGLLTGTEEVSNKTLRHEASLS